MYSWPWALSLPLMPAALTPVRERGTRSPSPCHSAGCASGGARPGIPSAPSPWQAEQCLRNSSSPAWAVPPRASSRAQSAPPFLARSRIGQPHHDRHGAVVTLVGVGHAPVDVVVQPHAVAGTLAFAAEAGGGGGDRRLAAAVVVGHQVVLAIVGVAAGTDPGHLGGLAAGRAGGQGAA